MPVRLTTGSGVNQVRTLDRQWLSINVTRAVRFHLSHPLGSLSQQRLHKWWQPFRPIAKDSPAVAAGVCTAAEYRISQCNPSDVSSSFDRTSDRIHTSRSKIQHSRKKVSYKSERTRITLSRTKKNLNSYLKNGS